MIEVVIATHGKLALEFLKVAEAVLEQKLEAITLCFDFNTGSDEYSTRLKGVIEGFPTDHNILIFTDFFGGTPSNISIPYVQQGKIEVITGLNLAMLIYFFSQTKKSDFSELVKGVQRAGKEAILIAGDFMT